MRNASLLVSVMEQIRDHPELHNQEVFFSETDCGTACCFGGWACMLGGAERSGPYWAALPSDGVARGAWEVAQELLGLTDIEALTLFSPANSRKALELMVEDLVNGQELMSGGYYRGLAG